MHPSAQYDEDTIMRDRVKRCRIKSHVVSVSMSYCNKYLFSHRIQATKYLSSFVVVNINSFLIYEGTGHRDSSSGRPQQPLQQ
jgi:hypothetical protein